MGYPKSPPELRQELIAEQFVRGQSDPELKKYLWVVIRTQKERKLQTLIEVCTDFSSLTAPTHTHRPAEQTFAVHRPMEASCVEEDCESEDCESEDCESVWTYAVSLPTPGRILTIQTGGLYLQSEGRQQRDGDTPPGNSV